MLNCGRTWQPSSVDRVIETYPTSTRVAKVRTDLGIGFLKGLGNPSGNESLACELVGSELASQMGLKVPPFAIVELAGLEIPMKDYGTVNFGPAFVSKEITAVTADGGDTFLRRLTDQADVARLVMFDTWIRNMDRCPPADYFDPEPRRDNLLFSPSGQKFTLVAFDHSHCFVEGELEFGLAGDHFVNDARIYGLFPEFGRYLDEATLRLAAQAIRNVDAAVIEEIVHSIPPDWGPSSIIRTRWADLIFKRGEIVAEQAFEQLVSQAQLGF